VTRVVVGRVGKPHGLDGAFFVEDPRDDGRWFEPGARLWAGDEELEVVLARRGAGGRPVIRLDREVARGTELEVPVEALPPVGEDEYYAFQLVGLEVIEEGGRRIATELWVVPGVANVALDLDCGIM
jgi:16S rRNA processing protein RimM